MSDDNPFGSIFSPIEQQMGQDAYQSMLKTQEAQTAAVVAMMSARTNLYLMVSAILFLVALPCIVWLWRWAL